MFHEIKALAHHYGWLFYYGKADWDGPKSYHVYKDAADGYMERIVFTKARKGYMCHVWQDRVIRSTEHVSGDKNIIAKVARYLGGEDAAIPKLVTARPRPWYRTR